MLMNMVLLERAVQLCAVVLLTCLACVLMRMMWHFSAGATAAVFVLCLAVAAWATYQDSLPS